VHPVPAKHRKAPLDALQADGAHSFFSFVFSFFLFFYFFFFSFFLIFFGPFFLLNITDFHVSEKGKVAEIARGHIQAAEDRHHAQQHVKVFKERHFGDFAHDEFFSVEGVAVALQAGLRVAAAKGARNDELLVDRVQPRQPHADRTLDAHPVVLDANFVPPKARREADAALHFLVKMARKNSGYVGKIGPLKSEFGSKNKKFVVAVQLVPVAVARVPAVPRLEQQAVPLHKHGQNLRGRRPVQ